MIKKKPYSDLRWHLPGGAKVIGRDHPETEEERKQAEKLIKFAKNLPDSAFNNKHHKKLREQIKAANKKYGLPEDENL
ncbi:hypothetical protein DS834_02980 [Lactobacillus bombicola]|uniref:Uncharacterized protein n=1 Tax=Lactobacillus bombicola TaxID=1505723 RepID=A0ABX9LVR4_9LACO|nr:hypothetical protein [Lactobacillus bombicola]RHW52864.1 hypothetical protein DS834_02980 [Lactobacillus bombicola]